MTPPTDNLTPISDEDLEATFKRLSLPRAWPDDERAFRQEVRQRLGRIEQLLEALVHGPDPGGGQGAQVVRLPRRASS